jgi:hypothetical protein
MTLVLARKYAAYARPAQGAKSSCIVSACSRNAHQPIRQSRIITCRTQEWFDCRNRAGLDQQLLLRTIYAPEQTLADTHASIRLASKVACTTSQVKPGGEDIIATSYSHSLYWPVARHGLKGHPCEAGLSARPQTNRRSPRAQVLTRAECSWECGDESMRDLLQCTRRRTAGALCEVPARDVARCGRTLGPERDGLRNEPFVTVSRQLRVQHAGFVSCKN